LTAFRELLPKYNIDGYILFRTDAHDSEYLPKWENRLEFISGFSGSNGLAYISKDVAWCWTDGRYFIQIKKELLKGWEMQKMARGGPHWSKTVLEAC
jgi:Xaa-Pro aminopeptidase